MNKKGYIQIITIIAGFLLLMSVLSYITWMDEEMPNFTACIINESAVNDECVSRLISTSPPIRGVEEIAEACKRSEEDCIIEIGKRAITKKIITTAKTQSPKIQKAST